MFEIKDLFCAPVGYMRMKNHAPVNVFMCSKLTVHPAPYVHILAAGCINFSSYAPGWCIFFPHNEYLYIGMCM